MSSRSYFSTALNQIIDRSFEERASALADSAGMPTGTLSKLTTGAQKPTESNLVKLADAVCAEDRRVLVNAYARDLIPAKYHDLIFSQAIPQRSHLPLEIARALNHLEETATDPDTAAFLSKIGRWIGPAPDASIARLSAVKGADEDPWWIDFRGGIAAGKPIVGALVPEPIPASRKYPEDYYALRVFGDSMSPKIHDGDMIVVRAKTEPGYPKKGTIVVYSDGMGSTLKVFGYRKKGGHEIESGEEITNFGLVPILSSLNPAVPGVQTMDGGRIDAIYVETL